MNMHVCPSDAAGNVEVVPRQDAITAEVSDTGDLILRQEDALGGDEDRIDIAAANVSRFIEMVTNLTPHGSCPPWCREADAAPRSKGERK
jgi:hypothetical protein